MRRRRGGRGSAPRWRPIVFRCAPCAPSARRGGWRWSRRAWRGARPRSPPRSSARPRRWGLTPRGGRQAEIPTQSVGAPGGGAFDAEGRPTRAAEGFAKSQGVSVGELTVVTTERGRYAAVVKAEPCRPAAVLLKEALPRIIDGLSFGRSMRWEPSGARFASPIRWIVALYDGKVIPFSHGGVASGSRTRGHALTSPGWVRVAGDWAGYAKTLEQGGVLVDHERRRAVIESQLATAAKAAGGRFLHDNPLLHQ